MEGVFGDLGDFKVSVVLQGGLQNQGQIVGGRVVVFVVDAHRVGKVGVLAAQLGGLPVHMVHKVLDGAVHSHSQHVAGVGVGGDKRQVEQLLHSEHLSQLEIGVDVGLGDSLHPGFPGGDGGVQGELAILDGLQHQQGGHNFGNAGGIGLFGGPHIV